MSRRTHSIGGFKPFGEGERPIVYGQDLTPGWYRSRFGFRVIMRPDRTVWKERANGEYLQIHPGVGSRFYRIEQGD